MSVSLHVRLPTDTPRAPTIGACRASAAKRRPLHNRERTRSARAHEVVRRRESVEKQPVRRTEGSTRAHGERQRHNGGAAMPRGQANSPTNSGRLLARKRAKLIQEGLTNSRRQRRPIVTSEARVGRFAQHAFFEKTLRRFQGPRAPPRGRIRFGSTFIRSHCVLSEGWPRGPTCALARSQRAN